MITNFDASITGWCSLLPQSKKKLFRSDGTLDEQLFRAEVLINTLVSEEIRLFSSNSYRYVIDIHRPFSDLAYSAVESVSRCAPPAPKHTPIPSNHTPRILRAIESFNKLLTLSGSLKVHTPFIICMIANTTVAYLSACRHILDSIAVKLAREKIRMNMGLLKALGKHWPLAERTYQEVGIIAREILCLLDHDVSPPATYCLVGRSSHSKSPPIFDLDHEIDLTTLLGFEQIGF